jgi:hypothetical protein
MSPKDSNTTKIRCFHFPLYSLLEGRTMVYRGYPDGLAGGVEPLYP